MGSTLKGKNLLPWGADSFFLEYTLFQKEDITIFKGLSSSKVYEFALKAPYSSKIDIFIIQERFKKLIYSINTIIKCGT